MKIVYISMLPKTLSGGPRYSVPAQIFSQSLFDDVVWINMSNVDVSNLPITPINLFDAEYVVPRIRNEKPDVVVFEDFYYLQYIKISKALVKEKIPYIIIPRGSMTKKAQKNKYLKKAIANVLLFNKFVKQSLAIEYLARNEYLSVPNRWRKKTPIIIPNGTNSVAELGCKRFLNNNCLRGVFIGRINLYHKGLDLFLKACFKIKNQMADKNMMIDIYGPCSNKVREEIQNVIKSYGLDNIVHVYDEIHGIEKQNVLKKSDFFVLTSRFEGMPMGVLEALSFGLPCLLTYETNVGDLVSDSNAGFVSRCDIDGITNNLLNFLKCDVDSLVHMSSNALKLSKSFEWNSIAEKSHCTYEQLLKGLANE